MRVLKDYSLSEFKAKSVFNELRVEESGHRSERVRVVEVWGVQRLSLALIFRSQKEECSWSRFKKVRKVFTSESRSSFACELLLSKSSLGEPLYVGCFFGVIYNRRVGEGSF